MTQYFLETPFIKLIYNQVNMVHIKPIKYSTFDALWQKRIKLSTADIRRCQLSRTFTTGSAVRKLATDKTKEAAKIIPGQTIEFELGFHK